MVLSASLINST